MNPLYVGLFLIHHTSKTRTNRNFWAFCILGKLTEANNHFLISLFLNVPARTALNQYEFTERWTFSPSVWVEQRQQWKDGTLYYVCVWTCGTTVAVSLRLPLLQIVHYLCCRYILSHTACGDVKYLLPAIKLISILLQYLGHIVPMYSPHLHNHRAPYQTLVL